MPSVQTEEQLLDALAASLGNPLELEYTNDDVARVFQQLVAVDGLSDLLRAMMGRDMQLYWLAQNDTDRAHIKGAFQRMAWIRAQMRKVVEAAEIEERKKKREAK